MQDFKIPSWNELEQLAFSGAPYCVKNALDEARLYLIANLRAVGIQVQNGGASKAIQVAKQNGFFEGDIQPVLRATAARNQMHYQRAVIDPATAVNHLRIIRSACEELASSGQVFIQLYRQWCWNWWACRRLARSASENDLREAIEWASIVVTYLLHSLGKDGTVDEAVAKATSYRFLSESQGQILTRFLTVRREINNPLGVRTALVVAEELVEIAELFRMYDRQERVIYEYLERPDSPPEEALAVVRSQGQAGAGILVPRLEVMRKTSQLANEFRLFSRFGQAGSNTIGIRAKGQRMTELLLYPSGCSVRLSDFDCPDGMQKRPLPSVKDGVFSVVLISGAWFVKLTSHSIRVNGIVTRSLVALHQGENIIEYGIFPSKESDDAVARQLSSLFAWGEIEVRSDPLVLGQFDVFVLDENDAARINASHRKFYRG